MWKSVMALAAVALLSSACDGGVQSGSTPAAAQLSGKHGETMLYVTSGGNPNFAIYSFPAAKLLRGIYSFANDGAMCSDAAGNVYITDINYTGKIDVYAHGAIQPTGEIPLPGFETNGCSVDSGSGDLAVADFRDQAGTRQGGISIFADAQGTPAFYQDPDIDWYSGVRTTRAGICTWPARAARSLRKRTTSPS